MVTSATISMYVWAYMLILFLCTYRQELSSKFMFWFSFLAFLRLCQTDFHSELIYVLVNKAQVLCHTDILTSFHGSVFLMIDIWQGWNRTSREHLRLLESAQLLVLTDPGCSQPWSEMLLPPAVSAVNGGEMRDWSLCWESKTECWALNKTPSLEGSGVGEGEESVS